MLITKNLNIMQKIVTIPELKKGNIVGFNGALFLIEEDAIDYGIAENTGLNVFASKAKFISYENGDGKKGNILLENFDSFQGNELAKAAVLNA